MSLFKSTKHAENCPECGASLQLKRGKQGLFLGCSAYPACHYLKPLQQTSHVIKELGESCPECGAALQLKQGHWGIFIGCSAYPNCHFIVSDDADEEESILCPVCKQHHLVKRTGRSGKAFYGCAGYPECKFTLFSKPITQLCPQCAFPLATSKKVRGKSVYQCANRACQHTFNEPE